MAHPQRETRSIPVGPTAQAAAAEWTLDRLAAFGVPLPAGNRLQRARALIHDVNTRRIVLVPDDADLLERVNEAQWTIIEQYVIARALGRPGRTLEPNHARKLEEMLSGADVPDADRNPTARNTQFELYVAAYLTMGEVGVAIGEPDLIIDYLGAPHGLAAKRVRSFKQAPRRAREAADQISAAGMSGIVAVNVDVLLSLSDSSPEPARTLTERVEVLNNVERTMSDLEQVVATFTFGRDAVWDFRGPRPSVSVSHSVRFTVHPRPGRSEEAGRAFFDRLFENVDERMGTL